MTGFLALLLLAVQETPTAERAAFAARYDLAGLEFEAAPDATLRLGAVELRRGDVRLALGAATPRHDGAFTLFERAPGVLERFERSPAGIEHSLVVDGPLGGDGDLVVRVEVGGTNAGLGERLADGSHRFGAISYGRLFGIDADGEHTDGDVRLVDGGLELVIDDAWLDAAAWPITLDPVIAPALVVTSPTALSVSTGEGEVDDDPDAAYDVTTGNYLHAFERTRYTIIIPGLPPGDQESICLQRLDSQGVPVGTVATLDNDGARDPRVANVAKSNRFAVTWFNQSNFVPTLDEELTVAVVDADDGTVSGSIVLATGNSGDIVDHDLAGESSTSLFVSGRAFAVWIDDAGDVKFARVNVGTSGDPTLAGIHTLATDPGVFDSWTEVSIARCTSTDGHLVVALVRHSTFLGSTKRVYALTVDRSGTVVTPPTLVSGSDDQCVGVSVDGGGSNPSRWVVTWEDSNAQVIPQFTLRAVVLAGSGSAWTSSTPRSHGTAFTRFHAEVGWRPGMAIVAFERPLSDDISVCMLCDETAEIGEDKSIAFDWPDNFLVDYETSDAVVALRTSGGDTSAHEGLLLCRRVGTSSISTLSVIAARRYDAFDPAAVAAPLLTGCGGVGSIVVPSPPAIGNPDFRIELAGAGPTASLAILNLTAVQPIQTCGSCSFAPLDILTFVPIVGGAAEIALPVPCKPSLAGAQLHAQWIVYKPGVAPCAFVPDFGATQIMEITVN
jgi:hypothetical protein